MNLKSLASSGIFTALTLAVGATVSQPEKAAAVDLNFNTTTQTQVNTNPFGFNFGSGVGNTGTVATTANPNPNRINPNGTTAATVVNYTNVATISPGVTIDARITAQTFGTGYSFVEHIPNYSVNAAGQPTGDAGFLYQIAGTSTAGATGLGPGGMTYKIELFEGGGTFSTAFVAPELRLLAYDVDGERNSGSVPPGSTGLSSANQGEAVRAFLGDGLVGYQVGTNPNSLVPETSLDGTSIVFTGPGINYPEDNTTGAAILYFQNTSAVTLQFEADTLTPESTNSNPVFAAIDGDLSLIPNNTTNFDSNGYATTAAGFSGIVAVGAPSSSTAVPEPFTIVGTLVGGTAALRLRKKLKSTN
jgi:hypothetical protein